VFEKRGAREQRRRRWALAEKVSREAFPNLIAMRL
jgi:hypothetical protein